MLQVSIVDESARRQTYCSNGVLRADLREQQGIVMLDEGDGVQTG